MAEQAQVVSGQITFNGDLVTVNVSDLLGGQILPNSFEDVENTYLTSNRNNYKNPSAPYIDDYPYFSNIVKSNLHATLINNLPVSAVNYPNLPEGFKIYSYLQDFYFRIHLTPVILTLGNILTDRTEFVKVWNAYFNQNILNGIIKNSLGGITITPPVNLPDTFEPLQEKQMQIDILSEGEAVTSGTFTFSFTSDLSILNITGARVVVWPFLAIRNFSESRQWLTNIIKAKTAEERLILREIPRLTITASQRFRTQAEFNYARNLAFKSAHVPLGLPFWSEAVTFYSIPQGALSINLDTTNFEVGITDSLLLWESYNSFETAQIAAISSTTITFTLPTKNTRTNCWVIPLVIGYNNGGIQLSQQKNKLFGRVSVTGIKTFLSKLWPTPETLQSLPVLTTPSIVSGGLNKKFFRETETFDGQLGSLSKLNTENYSRRRLNVVTLAKNKQELYSLRRQLDYLEGKNKTFFLPSFTNDAKLLAPVLIGNTTLLVQETNFFNNPPKFVRIIGDTEQTVAVTQVTDNGDGTVNFLISPSITATINNIISTQITIKVRADTDTLEINHRNGLARVTLPVIEVEA